MKTPKQLRRQLKTFKKNERYTWEALSNLTGLTRPWLEKFAGETEDRFYVYQNLLTLEKFLKRQGK